MEEISKKIRGNAMISYFMVFVSLGFLMSKDQNVSHPFVKNHVKSAFILHCLLIGVIYIMSYNFFPGIHILDYSLNTIITALLSLFLFAAILYGMFMAHNGNTVTLGEIFHKVGVSKNIMGTQKSENISDETLSILILSHVPFLGYILYGKHRNITHIRDVVMINMIITFLSCFFFVIGYFSLASLLMLIYIIYSVFQGIKLTTTHSVVIPDTHFIPSAEEKYILQKSLFRYIKNSLSHTPYETLTSIRQKYTQRKEEQEKIEEEIVLKLPDSKIPSEIFYIPVLNIITLFSSQSNMQFHRRNGLVLTLISLLIIMLFFRQSDLLIFMLFPISFGMGYAQRKAYKMPYIYDIYALYSVVINKIGHLFHKTRALQKTEIQQSIKIGEQKK